MHINNIHETLYLNSEIDGPWVKESNPRVMSISTPIQK